MCTVQYIGDRIEKFVGEVNKEICSNCPCKNWKSNYNTKYTGKDNKVSSCCRDCGSANGYFTNRGLSGKDFRKAVGHLKRLYSFTKEYGFFDFENKTCKLPRHRRSHTCLSFYCEATTKALRKKHGKLIMELLHSYADFIIQVRKGKIWKTLR